MNAHNRKTRDAILGHPAPRDIEWMQFINMWEDVADEVEQEHGHDVALPARTTWRPRFRRRDAGDALLGDGFAEVDDVGLEDSATVGTVDHAEMSGVGHHGVGVRGDLGAGGAIGLVGEARAGARAADTLMKVSICALQRLGTVLRPLLAHGRQAAPSVGLEVVEVNVEVNDVHLPSDDKNEEESRVS